MLLVMTVVHVPYQPALCTLAPVSCSVDRTESKTGSERLSLDR